MAIPKLAKDLEIIQKLSDLPNATDGLTAEELKEKFDEAAKLIKEYLNDVLIPAISAKNIPFTRITEINASDVQNAIVEVQKQVRDAVNGAIPNQSVTKEKLSAALLARVYGGVPWVSVKTPGAEDNNLADFPLGQIWLRPSFTVKNLRKTSWSSTGCTVEAVEQQVKMTGDKTSTDGTMTQSLTGIGNEGDTVYVLFDLTEKDSEITELTISINNGENESIGESFSKAVKLQPGGSVTMTVSATWPSMTLADGNVVLTNFTIVNASEILRQTAGAKDMADWITYLREIMPITEYLSAAEIFIQTADGQWLSMMYDVLPQERGGTGRNTRFEPGLLMLGGADGSFDQFPAPDVEHCLLSFADGAPKWVTRESVATEEGAIRSKSGTYEGNDSDREIDLGCEPKMIRIHKVGYGQISTENGGYHNYDSAILFDGETAEFIKYVDYTVGSTEKTARCYGIVKLSKNVLEMYDKYDNDTHTTPVRYFNENGATYQWVAFY